MHVYFILDEKSNAVKIGKANNIHERFSDLQTGNPNKLEVIYFIECSTVERSSQLEKKLHKKFDSLRIRTNGEWFTYDEEVFRQFFKEDTDFITKEKRKPLIINTLFGETIEYFGIKNNPQCYFYSDLSAQIMDSYENSIRLSVPFRVMRYPTYGKQMLLPYSTETDKVFISYKKHKENMELNRFNRTEKPDLEKFLNP
jgi:hypothetical protein